MPKQPSQSGTILFVVIICVVCASILAILASALREPQLQARELYKSKQLLVAAHILSYNDTFLFNSKPAVYDTKKQMLIPFNRTDVPKAKNRDIRQIVEKRFLARLVDREGNVSTFDEAGINKKVYFETNEKYGYAQLPNKLLYIVMPNTPSDNPYGYVIPVNGYGLWDAIYGYLGLSSNGDTIIGMTWYDQKETPGLGGNIALPSWQKQFYNKVIFQKNAEGQTNFARAPLGITVVKTTVAETFGNSPKGESAVDGIPGASITANGVSASLRASLAPYRPFLEKIAKAAP